MRELCTSKPQVANEDSRRSSVGHSAEAPSNSSRIFRTFSLSTWAARRSPPRLGHVFSQPWPARGHLHFCQSTRAPWALVLSQSRDDWNSAKVLTRGSSSLSCVLRVSSSQLRGILQVQEAHRIRAGIRRLGRRGCGLLRCLGT